MRYILTAGQMRSGDTRTINEIGVPSMVLMERAALKSVEAMEQEGVDCSRALIVCGSGNNGGDGFAVARLLMLKGHAVTVVFAGKEKALSEETRQQMRILENYGVSIGNTIEDGEYSVMVDAIFGIGLTREVAGGYAEIIFRLNEMTGTKVALDIPSGIHADTGAVMGVAVKADITVAFGCEKLGTILHPGNEYAGKTITADIGIDSRMYDGSNEICFAYEKKDIPTLLPERKEDSHKGTYGKVLMITGSDGMAGAAYLSAKAAYAMGAGLVQIYTVRENQTVLQSILPEAIIRTYASFDPDELHQLIDWADVAAIGSGLGQGRLASKLVQETVSYIKKPCLIDADGLNLLAGKTQMLKEGNFILTPHLKEMSRLLGKQVKEIKEKRFQILKEFVQESETICVLKDSRTLVAGSENQIYINTSGNAAMAKAGSGDVLAGVITGLLAQGQDCFAAGTAGVYLHGLFGDLARDKKGKYSAAAGDLIDAVGEVLKETEGCE